MPPPGFFASCVTSCSLLPRRLYWRQKVVQIVWSVQIVENIRVLRRWENTATDQTPVEPSRDNQKGIPHVLPLEYLYHRCHLGFELATHIRYRPVGCHQP